MYLSKNIRPASRFIILFGLLLSLSQIACSESQQVAAENLIGAVSNKIDATLEEPSELLFAGQIVDENEEWQNDYVVVLFKDGDEVARTTSRLADNALTEEGPMDGVFELRIENEYKLTPEHLFEYSNDATVPMEKVPGIIGMQYVGAWLGALQPNQMQIIEVEAKQVQYTVVVLGVPSEQVPDTHLRGKLAFDVENSKLITNVITKEEQEAAKETAVTSLTTQSTIQFTVLPSLATGVEWHLQITGYSGNRWDVWERFIAGYVPGIDWETFNRMVLDYNPQLVLDGFIFHPDKIYLLPMD